MQPYSFLGDGVYTNPASPIPVTVSLIAQPDFFRVRDITNWGLSTTAAAQLESFYYPNTMAAASYLQIGQASASASTANLYTAQGTTGGFTFINSANPPTFAALPATLINYTTWVINMTSTANIFVGDTVRIINPVGMLQAASIVGQVTAVTTNTSITLGYVASAVSAGVSFTANATSASVLKFYPSRFYPAARQVMYITQAPQAVVYFARPNNFTPGEVVDFNIPSTYGMTQLNFLTKAAGGAPTVLSVTNSATVSSITLNVNSTGFTAFSYPSSAASVGAASPPTCSPGGSGIVPLNGSLTPPASPPGTNLADAFDNQNQYYMYLGSSVVGAGSATMIWEAYKADFNNLSYA